MTFTVEIDGAGQRCIVGEQDGRGYWLVLDDVVFDAARGHGYRVDRQAKGLHRLSPLDAEMLRWYEAEHPRAEPNIFAGDPPD